MTHIIRYIERPSRDLIAAISPFSAATLHEAQGRRGAVDSRIKPVYSGMRACGPAITASCHPGDNIMLIAAISVAEPGDVLVVSAGDHQQQGGFGEVLATACKAKGIVGIVTDAGVRDGIALREMGFAAFCYGLSVKGTVKETLGTVNHPIILGGMIIMPGDIITADDDGVVVVRQQDVAEVARLSAERDAKEVKLIKALSEGGDVLELTGIGAVLRRKGCTFS